ncbi:GNAT family N-acetyltransferase [Blastococcus sp. SYSU DS0617]
MRRAETDLLLGTAAFDGLAEEWAALAAACPAATPFQAHPWLSSWARAYVPDGELRVAVVRRDGALRAAAPLHRVRRGPWRVLAPLGGDLSDHTDVLVHPDADAADLDALARVLLDEPGWSLLDLPEVRPGASAVGWAGHWPGAVTRMPASTCLELPAQPLPDLMAARMPGRTANTMRRKLRKIEAAGLEITEAAPPEVPGAVDALLRLHAEQWAGRGGTPEHFTGRFRAHLVRALPAMIAGGQAALVEYRLGGELVLAQILLIGRDEVAYYLAGIAPRLRDRVDTAALLVQHDVALAVARGAQRYSMLRGQEDYKLRWRPDAVVQTRLLLTRPGLAGAGYPLLARGRAAAVRQAKARAPWLRDVLARLRG